MARDCIGLVIAKETIAEETPAPFVTLQAIEVEMGYLAVPPVEWGSDVGELADNDSSAERLLALWMERAWRRPVSSGERKPFFALYRKVRQQGAGFDAALRSAFHSVLMSAPFRYLSPATESQHAIASRLSFMLTGAPPDAILRRLGQEPNSAMPRCSMHRLTGCWLIRADAFVRPFVRQWLVMGSRLR